MNILYTPIQMEINEDKLRWRQVKIQWQPKRNITTNNRCASITYFVEFGATAASQDCLNEFVCCVVLCRVVRPDDDLFRFVLCFYFSAFCACVRVSFVFTLFMDNVIFELLLLLINTCCFICSFLDNTLPKEIWS